MKRIALCLLLCLLLVAICFPALQAQAGENDEELVTHFQELIDEYVKYFNEKNAERIAGALSGIVLLRCGLVPPQRGNH